MIKDFIVYLLVPIVILNRIICGLISLCKSTKKEQPEIKQIVLID